MYSPSNAYQEEFGMNFALYRLEVVPRGETGVTRGHLARTLVLPWGDDVDPPKDRLSTHLVNT